MYHTYLRVYLNVKDKNYKKEMMQQTENAKIIILVNS